MDLGFSFFDEPKLSRESRCLETFPFPSVSPGLKLRSPRCDGVDPLQGQTPLHIATEGGHCEAAQRLIDARADLEAKDDNGPGAWEGLEEPEEEGLLWQAKRAAMFMFVFDSVYTTALKQL